MHHIRVFKTAHHLRDGIGFADVGQKLVAQAFAFGGPGHQAGNVHKFHYGGQNALGLDDVSQRLQARVRHFHHAHVGFNGAEGVVGRFDTGFGQGVEKGRFADVGQADDAAFETHGCVL